MYSLESRLKYERQIVIMDALVFSVNLKLIISYIVFMPV